MTEQEIRNLLALFYEGTSTPDQEHLLADYFASGAPVAPDLEADRRLFGSLSRAEAAEDFDQRFADALDSAAASRPRRRLTAWLSGVAACALLVASGFEAYNAFDGTEPAPMALSATEVAEQTRLALQKFNSTFNRGIASLDIASEKTVNATQTAFSKL